MLYVRLKEDTQALSEVVVVGYGVQKKEKFDRGCFYGFYVGSFRRSPGDKCRDGFYKEQFLGLVITGDAIPGKSKTF